MIYDGRDTGDVLRVLAVRRQTACDRDVVAESIPGRDGLRFSRVEKGGRAIEVDVALVQPTAGAVRQVREIESARRELNALLLRDRPCELVLPDAPDLADLAVAKDVSDIERLAYIGTATVTFQCMEAASRGETRTGEMLDGGKLWALVGGNAPTAPVVMVRASGPFSVLFDGVPFEVTGSPDGYCGIDGEKGAVECAGAAVRYAVTSDIPVWEPGRHTVECELPYAVRWVERWS